MANRVSAGLGEVTIVPRLEDVHLDSDLEGLPFREPVDWRIAPPDLRFALVFQIGPLDSCAALSAPFPYLHHRPEMHAERHYPQGLQYLAGWAVPGAAEAGCVAEGRWLLVVHSELAEHCGLAEEWRERSRPEVPSKH